MPDFIGLISKNVSIIRPLPEEITSRGLNIRQEGEVLQEQRFTKRDWTLFRTKIADWQEAYMDRLCREYIELLSKDDAPSERFWQLDKRIKEDKRKAGVRLRLSRTDFIYNIISLINCGAISVEDLEDFSDELKETVNFFFENRKWDDSDEE